MISGYGVLGGGKEKTKIDIERWTKEQKRLAKGFIGDYLMPRVGEGLEAYGGILPGTAGPGDVQKEVFAAAEGWSPFVGASKEDIDKRVAERLGTRQKLLAPTREKQDALLKEQAARMGLTYSSDILKERSDVESVRAAEEEAFTQGLYDTYERLNLEVTPQALQAMANIGEMQRGITEMGLTAEFNEWIRTQPEYSPVIDQILAVLGMQPVEKGTKKTDYFYWEAGGEARSGGGGAQA